MDKNHKVVFYTTLVSSKRKSAWTDSQDKILRDKAKEYQYKKWSLVAKYIPGKTGTQCSRRINIIKRGVSKGAWSLEEDKQLIKLYNRFGRKWVTISKHMPQRTDGQIRDRYVNYLDPKIKKTKFSKEEDATILKWYKIYKHSWVEIAKKVEGRTCGVIKKRFYSTLRYRLQKGNIVEFNENSNITLNNCENDNNTIEIKSREEKYIENLPFIKEEFKDKNENEEKVKTNNNIIQMYKTEDKPSHNYISINEVKKGEAKEKSQSGGSESIFYEQPIKPMDIEVNTEVSTCINNNNYFADHKISNSNILKNINKSNKTINNKNLNLNKSSNNNKITPKKILFNVSYEEENILLPQTNQNTKNSQKNNFYSNINKDIEIPKITSSNSHVLSPFLISNQQNLSEEKECKKSVENSFNNEKCNCSINNNSYQNKFYRQFQFFSQKKMDSKINNNSPVINSKINKISGPMKSFVIQYQFPYQQGNVPKYYNILNQNRDVTGIFFNNFINKPFCELSKLYDFKNKFNIEDNNIQLTNPKILPSKI